MNLLKSMFMTAYMMMTLAVSAYAGWQLYRGGPTLDWAGVMLSAAPAMLFLMGTMMLKNVPQTSPHLPLLNLMAMAGVAMAGWQPFAHGGALDAFTVAVGGWMGLMLYIYWYSRFGREPSLKLVIGARLPEFEVADVDGKSVSSASFAGKPAVLVFYRGNWCPFCMAQVKQLAARYRELEALGVRVILISPQPYGKNAQLAARFGVNMDFLVDEGNVAARILELDEKNGLPLGMQMMGYDSETVLPTVIITDGNGRVVWVHETDSYRIRPEPDVYLEVLRAHKLIPAAPGAGALKVSAA
jgi:peroxiredoxin